MLLQALHSLPGGKSWGLSGSHCTQVCASLHGEDGSFVAPREGLLVMRLEQSKLQALVTRGEAGLCCSPALIPK